MNHVVISVKYFYWKALFCKRNNIEFLTIRYLQMESLIELRTPVISFGLGGKFPLLIGKVRPNEIHFDEWPEHPAGYHPFEIVSCYHWK